MAGAASAALPRAARARAERRPTAAEDNRLANHKSARKRIRRNAKAAERNGARRSRIRTFVRKCEEAIASGDKEAATARFREMQPELHRGVAKGVVHRNAAARKLSRLSARIKALQAQLSRAPDGQRGRAGDARGGAAGAPCPAPR